MSGISSRLHRVLRNEATMGAAVSVILTGLAAITSFAMLTALARSMSAADFGLLAGWMNALLFLSVVAVFGQETVFVRHWNEFVQQRQFGRARGLLLFGIGVSTVGAALVAVGIYMASPWFAASRELMVALLLFLFAQTLCLFSSQTARITAGIASGVIHREITWRCMVLLGIAWFAYTWDAVHAADLLLPGNRRLAARGDFASQIDNRLTSAAGYNIQAGNRWTFLAGAGRRECGWLLFSKRQVSTSTLSSSRQFCHRSTLRTISFA